jgi:hypothetical protein
MCRRCAIFGSSSTLSTKVGTHAARHAHSQPVRSAERMALITARMSVVRGCPPGLAGGMSGSRIAHSLSLTSTSDNFFAASFHLFPLSPLGILFPFSLLYFTIWHASRPRRSPGHFIGLVLSHLPSQAFAHSLSNKKEGIDDAFIQPYSGHASRQSLEIYSRLSLADAQPSYSQAMERFSIQ